MLEHSDAYDYSEVAAASGTASVRPKGAVVAQMAIIRYEPNGLMSYLLKDRIDSAIEQYPLNHRDRADNSVPDNDMRNQMKAVVELLGR